MTRVKLFDGMLVPQQLRIIISRLTNVRVVQRISTWKSKGKEMEVEVVESCLMFGALDLMYRHLPLDLT